MIAFPVLLGTGISPPQALATNKLQGSFGTTTAALHFLRNGEIERDGIIFAMVCTFIGAALGTVAVSHLDSRILMTLIPILLIASALYFLFSTRVGDVERQRRISMGAFSMTIGAGLGFYDGFFGPGTGAFFALAFVTLLGFSMKKATAHSKVLNMTSNLAALLFFIIGGHLHMEPGAGDGRWPDNWRHGGGAPGHSTRYSTDQAAVSQRQYRLDG